MIPASNIAFCPFSYTSRTRGGDPGCALRFASKRLYFPHTRGWSRSMFAIIKGYSILPAHAGVIPRNSRIYWKIFNTSRTRGGDPDRRSLDTRISTYFPHTRGWSWPFRSFYEIRYILPAHAEVWFYTWIGFNEVNTYKGKCTQTGVHFFLDDYQFERIWQRPTVYTRKLSKFKVIASPDFSLYTDPKAMQIL